MKTPSMDKLDPAHFTGHPEVLACMAGLRKQFGDNFEKLLVSDTLDAEGHQYVNLVQKGGGVLGVALVGYTYVLEKVGIRFLRLAGTSAGAINTSLLTVIGNKTEEKSERILKYLCALNFFDLVDGHPFARWLIRNFISNKTKFEKKLRYWIIGLVLSLLLFVGLDIFFLGLAHYYPWASLVARICFVLTGFNISLQAGIGGYMYYMMSRLKTSGYGINPGTFFMGWLRDRMEENGVSTVTDLNKKAETIPTLQVRNPLTQRADTLKGDVTFITSELVSENKIELPKMCKLLRSDPDIDLHPAEFVRASMSIPIFFESHVIRDIPVEDPLVKQAWNEFFGITMDLPCTTRFIDGGMLSNFPINIFYNPKVIEPRLPSFGIDLDDTPAGKEKKPMDPSSWSIGIYIGRMFNTIRFYYDKDFLLKNSVFQQGIGTIPLPEFNWLNFFLTDDDKLKMFIRGAQAATQFLQKFDWPAYQSDRTKMQLILNEEKAPEK